MSTSMQHVGRADLQWIVAQDADAVHELLCACDRFNASAQAPAPRRNIETTKRRVSEGSVHAIERDGELVAAFTLTSYPPFGADVSMFPAARVPAYLSRLSMRPELIQEGAMFGLACVKKAIELAIHTGCDALRCEVNPDIHGVSRLLALLGFRECAREESPGGVKRAYLQKSLSQEASAPPGSRRVVS